MSWNRVKHYSALMFRGSRGPNAYDGIDLGRRRPENAEQPAELLGGLRHGIAARVKTKTKPKNQEASQRAATEPSRGREEQRNELLVALGERVRTVRARCGLTRKDAARAAGVSERHLANLE